MLAGGIVCIILSLPLLMFGFLGVFGYLPEDPGTAIVMAMVFALPGVILMTIGVRLIRKSHVQSQLQYEQMMAGQHWNHGNAAANDDYHYPQPDPNPSDRQYSPKPNGSYQIYNPLDPRTAEYINQQARRTPSSATSPHSATTASNSGDVAKTVDCPGCGAPQTLVPQQSRECEYCGTVVAYK